MHPMRQVLRQPEIAEDAHEDAHGADGVSSVQLRLQHAPPSEASRLLRSWPDAGEPEVVNFLTHTAGRVAENPARWPVLSACCINW